MNAYYLDNNVWAKLISDDAFRPLNKLLFSLAKARRVMVVGSTDLLSEFCGLAKSDRTNFGRRVGFFRDVTRDRVLPQCNELLDRELRAARRLALEEALADPLRVCEIWPRLTIGTAQQIASDVKNHEDATAQRMLKTLNEIYDRVVASLGPRAKSLNKQVFAINAACVEKIGADGMRRDAARLRLAPEHIAGLTLGSLPCHQAFWAFGVARAIRRLCDGKQFCGQDMYDWKHVTLAAAVGTFVTEDKDLQQTVRMIILPQVLLLSAQKFEDAIRAL